MIACLEPINHGINYDVNKFCDWVAILVEGQLETIRDTQIIKMTVLHTTIKWDIGRFLKFFLNIDEKFTQPRLK